MGDMSFKRAAVVYANLIELNWLNVNLLKCCKGQRV